MQVVFSAASLGFVFISHLALPLPFTLLLEGKQHLDGTTTVASAALILCNRNLDLLLEH